MGVYEVIAIDPDSVKSGVATLVVDSKSVKGESMSFPETISYVRSEFGRLRREGKRLDVVVEAGWKISKSNFHFSYGHVAENIAKKVGANQETGKKLIEMLKWYGLDPVEMKPLTKCWKGSDRKITHSELEQFTHLTQKRTNQDERDAMLLAWVYADLPIYMGVEDILSNK